MASKRPAGTRVETIHCEFCGEDYAATYKRCPFCDGKPAPEGVEEEDRYMHSNNRRGGGYGGGPPVLKIVGTVVSLAVIVAAVLIVVSIIKPLIGKGETPLPNPNDPSLGVQSPSPNPVGSADPVSSADPSAAPDPNATPDPNAPPPADQTATGFSVPGYQDVTLSSYKESFVLRVVLSPAGSTGNVTYTSGDPTVASVDESGKVTGLSRGNTTITIRLPGAEPQTCVVRCGFDAPAGAVTSPQPSGAPTTDPGNLKLNREDFTIKVGEKFTMAVTGASGTPAWSVDKANIASIGGTDGIVTGVAKGNATITCQVDGKTLTCIVRCS